MRTTSGYEPLADYVPQEDGTVAARLKAAGAIIIGKTNVSPLLGNIQSDNSIFGRTNNPWNVERTSGGSSGGAAAALAVGMTPLEIGSDLAGSIRIPAHFCGVYGLKTTEHRVSMWGHIPDVPGSALAQADVEHRPYGAQRGDLALAYQIISGPDGYDMDVPPVPVGDVPTRRDEGVEHGLVAHLPRRAGGRFHPQCYRSPRLSVGASGRHRRRDPARRRFQRAAEGARSPYPAWAISSSLPMPASDLSAAQVHRSPRRNRASRRGGATRRPRCSRPDHQAVGSFLRGNGMRFSALYA